jgi:hypothetical protein
MQQMLHVWLRDSTGCELARRHLAVEQSHRDKIRQAMVGLLFRAHVVLVPRLLTRTGYVVGLLEDLHFDPLDLI